MDITDWDNSMTFDEVMDVISINTGANITEIQNILDREFERIRAEGSYDEGIELFDLFSIVEDYVAKKSFNFDVPSDNDVNDFLFG